MGRDPAGVASSPLKRRPGERGPGRKPIKRNTTIRLDLLVIEFFQKDGPGWQTRINDALVQAIKDGRC